MRNALIPIALIVSAIVVLSTPADARRHGPVPDERLEKHLEELDLTSAQKEKVRVILDAGREERQKLRAQKREVIERMHSLLEQDPPDEAAIMLQAERIGDIRTEAHKVMLRTLLQIREQLSPEQRRQLMTIKRRECSAEQDREKG
jgi:Spy/CpxP family protein refolding chaperone